MAFSSDPMTIRGSTTYGDMVPGSAKAGDIIQFGDRLDMQNPQIANLVQQGFLAPYTDQGAIFTKGYTPTGLAGLNRDRSSIVKQRTSFATPPGNMRSQELTPTGEVYNAPAGYTPTPQNPPNVSKTYDASRLDPKVVKQYSTNLQHQLTGLLGGQNLPKGADLDYYARAFAAGGYTAQDIANDWWEQTHGTVGQTLGKGRIVDPTTSRWEWIVGGQTPNSRSTGPMDTGSMKTEMGVPSDVPPGTDTGTGTNVPRGTDYLSQVNGFLGDQGMGDIQVQDLPGMQLPDIIALSRQLIEDDDFLEAQLKSSEEAYQSLLNSISSQFKGLKNETIFKADTARAKQRAYLGRLGALGNSVAAEGMLQGMRDQKDEALEQIEISKAAAMVSAFNAWQTGKTDLLSKAYDKAKQLANDYTANIAKEWESRKSARQTGINEFTAKTNYLLGVYGKQLQAAGIQFDYDKLAQDAEFATQQSYLDQKKFDWLVEKEGDESARDWAKVTGYYVNDEGKLTATADHLIEMLKISQEDQRIATARSKAGSGSGAGGYTEEQINEALREYSKYAEELPPSNKLQRMDIVRQYWESKIPVEGPTQTGGTLPPLYGYTDDSNLPPGPKSVFEPYKGKVNTFDEFLNNWQPTTPTTTTPTTQEAPFFWSKWFDWQ